VTLPHSFKSVSHPSSHDTKILNHDTTAFLQECVSSVFARYQSHERYYQPGLLNACGSSEALQSVMDLGFQYTPPPSVLVSSHFMSCSYSHYFQILFNLVSPFFPTLFLLSLFLPFWQSLFLLAFLLYSSFQYALTVIIQVI